MLPLNTVGLHCVDGSPQSPASPPEWKVQFHGVEVGGSVPKKISRPGWARCPEAVLPCRGRSMTMASSLLPHLKLFGDFLLFVGFAFC